MQAHTWSPGSMSPQLPSIWNSSCTFVFWDIVIYEDYRSFILEINPSFGWSDAPRWLDLAVHFGGSHHRSGGMPFSASYREAHGVSMSHSPIFLTASFPSPLEGGISLFLLISNTPGSSFHPGCFYSFSSLFYFLRMNSGRWGKSSRKKWTRSNR